MQWKLIGQSVIDTVDEKELCMRHPPINLYPAGYPSMQSCMQFCQKLGSRSPPVITLQQWTNLKIDLEGVNNKRGPKNIWLTLNDEDTEGDWVDYFTHEVVNFSLPWAFDEPNGGNTENCVALRPSIKMLLDYPCQDLNYPHACICKRTPTPYLKLRGLCSKSVVKDVLFQPINDLKGFTRVTLVGFRTLIDFDNIAMTWILTDAESNVTGLSMAPYKSFTLGKHNWTIKGDKGCGRHGAEYTLSLIHI